MEEYNNWGDYAFQVMTMNEACQVVKSGVFIFAGKKNSNWIAYFIGKTNDFKTLSSHSLWIKAQNMGATHVHIFSVVHQTDRKSIVENLIKIYKPFMNSSEQLNQPEPKEKIMANETQLTAGQLTETKSKLELLYQYEKHYLELIKAYKEEIKFANSLQEDLRRERSQFFTQTLKEVVLTMKSAEVDKTVSAQWIQDLVASYTKSIDLSGDLAKTHVIEILSILTAETKREASEAKLDAIGKKIDAE